MHAIAHEHVCVLWDGVHGAQAESLALCEEDLDAGVLPQLELPITALLATRTPRCRALNLHQSVQAFRATAALPGSAHCMHPHQREIVSIEQVVGIMDGCDVGGIVV